MFCQIIIDDKHILAFVHEELGHGSCRIGGNELQAWRVAAFGNNNDTVFHCIVAFEFSHQLGNGRTSLANGAIDTEYILVCLVDNRIECNGGFAGLPVP